MHHLVGWTYHEHYGVTQRSCFFRRRDRNCILVTANPQPSQHEFVWKWDTPKIQLFIINSSIKLAILWVVYGGILVYIPFSDTHTPTSHNFCKLSWKDWLAARADFSLAFPEAAAELEARMVADMVVGQNPGTRMVPKNSCLIILVNDEWLFHLFPPKYG